MSISGVIVVENLQDDLKMCIKSLSFCSEVIVLSKSVLLNNQIVRKNKRVKSLILPLDSQNPMNFVQGIVKSKWTVFLESNERISKKLADEINKTILSDDFAGYYMKRITKVVGTWTLNSYSYEAFQLRLFKTGTVKWDNLNSHSWESIGNLGILGNELIRFMDPSLKEFLSEIDIYTTTRSQELFFEGNKTNIVSILLYSAGKFMKEYIVKGGFRKGSNGFVTSVMLSFKTFLLHTKLYSTAKS